jgi:hypothetical protein
MPPWGSQRRWIRHAVIRGDGAALGVTVIAGGVIGLGSSLVHGMLWLLVLSLALMVLGAVELRWARRYYRALIAEVVAAHASHDPGDSPVPWVSDAVWRLKNRFDPELDAANQLLAEVDRLHPRFGVSAGEPLRGVKLRPVGDNERGLVGVPKVVPSFRQTPSGTAEELLSSLASTPGRLLAVSPRWPVCCDRLSVLVGLSESGQPEGAGYLCDQEILESWDAAERRGQHAFTCGECGRSFTTDPAW